MTPRENLLAMLRGENPERLPMFIMLTDPVADQLESHKGTRDAVEGLGSDIVLMDYHIGDSQTVWAEAYAGLGVELPPDHVIWRMGITHVYPENRGEAYHFAQLIHPLEDVDDLDVIKTLPWPDPADPKHYLGLEDEIAEIKERGLVSMLSLTCTVFEDSWYLRGMDNLFADLIDEDEVGEWLLDTMTERSVEVARAYAAAGVDMIWLGDDIGTQRGMMMAPEFWREHFKPRLQQVIDAAREAAPGELYIMYHSDGDIEPVIEELFEMGIDVLNPVQPECMDVEEILTKYRDKGAFCGMIGTQTTMPHGSPEDVRSAVAQLQRLASDGIRLICAPTHVIEPDVPWANTIALAESPTSLVGECEMAGSES